MSNWPTQSPRPRSLSSHRESQRSNQAFVSKTGRPAGRPSWFFLDMPRPSPMTGAPTPTPGFLRHGSVSDFDKKQPLKGCSWSVCATAYRRSDCPLPGCVLAVPDSDVQR
jgi:hypothetical protein